jgi:hypothetical protein
MTGRLIRKCVDLEDRPPRGSGPETQPTVDLQHQSQVKQTDMACSHTAVLAGQLRLRENTVWQESITRRHWTYTTVGLMTHVLSSDCTYSKNIARRGNPRWAALMEKPPLLMISTSICVQHMDAYRQQSTFEQCGVRVKVMGQVFWAGLRYSRDGDCSTSSARGK